MDVFEISRNSAYLLTFNFEFFSKLNRSLLQEQSVPQFVPLPYRSTHFFQFSCSGIASLFHKFDFRLYLTKDW